jgi:hypothetical protein
MKDSYYREILNISRPQYPFVTSVNSPILVRLPKLGRIIR